MFWLLLAYTFNSIKKVGKVPSNHIHNDVLVVGSYIPYKMTWQRYQPINSHWHCYHSFSGYQHPVANPSSAGQSFSRLGVFRINWTVLMAVLKICLLAHGRPRRHPVGSYKYQWFFRTDGFTFKKTGIYSCCEWLIHHN